MDPAQLAEIAIAEGPALGLDAGDPLVAVLTWGLTALAGRVMTRAQARNARHALPAVALLLAVAARASWEAAQGSPLTVDVLLRASGAAGVAVLAHSQLREFGKVATERKRTAKKGERDDG